MGEYEQILKERLNQYKQEMESRIRPNIMILGKTGSGKSSLVNRVFPELKEKADVSDVRRGTTSFDMYTDGKINLIDTKGYEMESSYAEGDYKAASYNDFKKSVIHHIQETQKTPEKHIHIVWYCISIGGERIEPFDLDLLQALCHIEDIKNHIAVVLTKCDMDDCDGTTAKAFRRIIKEDGAVSHLPVFETIAQPEEDPLELHNLITWSADALGKIDVDGDLKAGFISAQMADLDSKWDLCVTLIRRYTVTAAGIAASPIPIPDAIPLTAEQVAMCAHIISTYNLDALTSISTSVVGDVFLSNLGKTIAGNLIKLIPGAGAVVGGAINATVASTLTAALGLGVAKICKTACEAILKEEKVDFDILFTFDSIMQAVKAATPNAKDLISKGTSE